MDFKKLIDTKGLYIERILPLLAIVDFTNEDIQKHKIRERKANKLILKVVGAYVIITALMIIFTNIITILLFVFLNCGMGVITFKKENEAEEEMIKEIRAGYGFVLNEETNEYEYQKPKKPRPLYNPKFLADIERILADENRAKFKLVKPKEINRFAEKEDSEVDTCLESDQDDLSNTPEGVILFNQYWQEGANRPKKKLKRNSLKVIKLYNTQERTYPTQEETLESLIITLHVFEKVYNMPPYKMTNREWDILFDTLYEEYCAKGMEEKYHQDMATLFTYSLASIFLPKARVSTEEVNLDTFLTNLYFLEPAGFKEGELDSIKERIATESKQNIIQRIYKR